MTVPAADDLDLDFVRSEETDLWVSILLPTLRDAPDSRAGSTLLANLLRDAAAELKARGVSDDRLAPATALVDDSNFWQRQSEGLAIYLSKDGMRSFRVARELPPTVAIGDIPRLRLLVPELAHEGEYNLLQLAQNQVRLFRVTNRTIEELDLGPIPASSEAVGGDRERQIRAQFTTPGGGGFMHGHGADTGVMEAQRQHFLRLVGRGVVERLGRTDQAVPLVVAATEDLAAAFRPVCDYRGLTDVTVPGNSERATPAELLERARPVLVAHQADQAQRRAERLQELRSGSRLVERPSAVLGAAQEGRIDALLVGANAGEAADGGPDDELVDRAIVATLKGGGRVLPMPATTTDTLIGVLRY